MAGPPVRSSIFTPVSVPPDISGPVTVFLLASMVGLAPTSSYSAPCSASGNQSVWIEIVSGHTPFRFVSSLAPPPAAPPPPDVVALEAAVVGAPAGVVAPAAVVVAPAAVVAPLLPLLSPPHAATTSAPAVATARIAARRWCCIRGPPLGSGAELLG